MGLWQSLVGTVLTSFKIGINKATLSASGLTAARTFTLPDVSLTVGLAHRWMFGDGSDGDVTYSSDGPQLTRDMYYNNLTLNVTLDTNGFDVFVAGTLTVNANLQATVQVGGNGIGTSMGGGGAYNNGHEAGANQITRWRSIVGGNGGNGGAGGGVGSNGEAGNTPGFSVSCPTSDYLQRLTPVGPINTISNPASEGQNWYGGKSGAGGNGGDGGPGGKDGGGGGGGGAGGRALRVFARTIVGSGTIAVNGGVGGNGANGGDGDGANVGGNGGNGGNGGDGGVLLVVSESFGGTVSYSAAGGAAGTKGLGGADNGGGAGSDGTDGTAGSAGVVIKFNPLTGAFS